MDQVGDFIGQWYASGGLWRLLVDLVVPSVAILVPTILAIRLASAERRAADADRKARDHRAHEERVAKGVEHAGSAMSHLVEAAYQSDFREAARMRFIAARELDHIRQNLGADNDAVWKWIVEELKIVSGGLEDTMDNGLPVLMEQIVHRGARFYNTMSDWRMGELDVTWFTSAKHAALADTKLLDESDEDDAGY